MHLEEFVAGFLLEAHEHLHSVNRNFVAVTEALQQGRPEPRAVRELFRSLHTIKGLASMVGAEPIVDIAHEMEGILRAADQAGGRLSEHALDVLLQGTRALEERIHVISKSGVRATPAAAPQLLEALVLAQAPETQPSGAPAQELMLPDELLSSLSAADREQASQAAAAGRRVLMLEFRPSPERAARGVNITSVRSRLSSVGELIKVIPRSRAEAPTGIAFCLLMVTDAADDVVAETLDGSADLIQEVRLSRRPQSSDLAVLSLEPEAQDWVGSDHSIRVDVRKLDEALERLSELVVTRFKLAHVAADLSARGVDTRELNAVLGEHGRQLKRLRTAITESRMVPLADLLQRLPLVVRGLTRHAQKTVNVSIQTGAAEVDKAVADKLFPAIVHLVRNAVDHAIEPVDERERAGKPPSGTLSITCDHASGANLMLRISDDGRGIDRGAVAHKLGRAPAANDEELLQQITTPGLSTRDGATHASGRGMGMDIVRRTIEMLAGGLSLQTAAGQGTTFTIRVPVSVSIVDVFSFVAGNQVFVAPVAMVDEIVEVEPERLVKSPAPLRQGPEPRLIQRRGEAIPLLGLDALLEQRPEYSVPQKALVVNRGRGAIAFGVSRMLGQQEVVVRPLADALVRVTGVTGATDLGDGRPTLVLDLLTLGASLGESAEVAS